MRYFRPLARVETEQNRSQLFSKPGAPRVLFSDIPTNSVSWVNLNKALRETPSEDLMAKKKTEVPLDDAELVGPNSKRPRLHKLSVKNFRCIGSTAVEIELDDIVVLVGPNNVGKSSILRAYEVAMLHGSRAGELSLDDFPNAEVSAGNLPEIELQTVIYDKAPGERWISRDPATGEMFVRERFTWSVPGPATREGFDVNTNAWDPQVPWGAANVAKAYRPQPHRVDAFASPDAQTATIVKLLKEHLEERVKKLQATHRAGQTSKYTELIASIGALQSEVVTEAREEIERFQGKLTDAISGVFPEYKFEFDARPEENLEKCLSLFKENPRLLMGPKDGFMSTVDRQGSGARRTLLWTALRIIADEDAEDPKSAARPHVLLMDEPELCLHPSAIREACRVLYDLPKSNRWQVMITTHSPVFIDFSRDNTTVVRVERGPNGVEGTTVFRPSRIKLDEDDRRNLKLLNQCDPYVAEFFFGGKTLVVEGDTEFTAFKFVIGADPERFRNLHIIRARGKATIVSLAKVLNQFDSTYSILHDSDEPTITGRKTKKQMNNGAWTVNSRILESVLPRKSGGKVRLVASVPNFELAYFGESVDDEKPYNALTKISSDPEARDTIVRLLLALIDHDAAVPTQCVEWTDIQVLKDAVDSCKPVPTTV
jgi:putative ATP-dependent endonuclease of OLD family